MKKGLGKLEKKCSCKVISKCFLAHQIKQNAPTPLLCKNTGYMATFIYFSKYILIVALIITDFILWLFKQKRAGTNADILNKGSCEGHISFM